MMHVCSESEKEDVRFGESGWDGQKTQTTLIIVKSCKSNQLVIVVKVCFLSARL